MSVPTDFEILEAAQRIKNYIHETPILTSEYLNLKLNCSLYFKCENFQKAGAFKSRGASNAIFLNLEKAKKYGVATHSSGNHAQALARVALKYGIKANIIMPSNSNILKISAVEEYKGNIHFCEPTLEARESTLKELISKTGAIEIHPYDNIHVITGQATAFLEFCSKIKNLDFVIAPVGGGGLLSGTALSAHYFSKHTTVIGAEPEIANDAYLSFNSKKFVASSYPNTIADGLRTSLGKKTFPIILKYVDKILTVSETEIIDATKLIFTRLKIVVEPSSAVALAVVIKYSSIFTNKNVGIILSGGNIDLSNFL